MKKFCVITTGRTGSTSLIDLLGSHSDISIPGKQIDSPDQELLYPKNKLRYTKHYAAALGGEIRNEHELIEAYFSVNEAYAYAGFKTMPGWHKELLQWA